MLRALVEFRIRGVKASYNIYPGFPVLTRCMQLDQYTFPLPSPHPRHLHWRENLDNGLLSSPPSLYPNNNLIGFLMAVHRRYP